MEWISVKDRLPDDGESALVFIPGYEDAYLSNRVAWADYDSGSLEWIYEGEATEDVTHWKPLDKPPEANND